MFTGFTFCQSTCRLGLRGDEIGVDVAFSYLYLMLSILFVIRVVKHCNLKSIWMLWKFGWSFLDARVFLCSVTSSLHERSGWWPCCWISRYCFGPDERKALLICDASKLTDHDSIQNLSEKPVSKMDDNKAHSIPRRAQRLIRPFVVQLWIAERRVSPLAVAFLALGWRVPEFTQTSCQGTVKLRSMTFPLVPLHR